MVDKNELLVTFKSFPTFANSFSNLQVDGEFADVTLVSDDLEEFTAHKIVLSSVSSVFKVLLSSHAHPHPLIHLGGVAGGELESMLEFIYSGQMTVKQEYVNNIVSFFEYFKLDDMVEEQIENIRSEVCSKNIEKESDSNIDFISKETQRVKTESNLIKEENNFSGEEKFNKHAPTIQSNILKEKDSFPRGENQIKSEKRNESFQASESQCSVTGGKNQEISGVKNKQTKLNHQIFNKLVSCPDCSKKVAYSEMKEHRFQNHNKFVIFCDLCTFKCMALDKIKLHKVTHHSIGDPELLKKKTVKSFQRQNDMKREDDIEIKNIKRNKKKNCDQCDFETIDRKTLRKHLKFNHLGIVLHCGKCDYQAVNKNTLRLHNKSEHVDENKINERLVCQKCGLRFQTLNQKKKHDLDNKMKIVPCPDCGEEFEHSIKKMRIHMFKKHSKFAEYCDQCDFMCSRGLERHKTVKHDGTKSLPCEHCGKLFAHQRYLKRHQDQMHKSDRDKPHQCQKCEKGFNLKQNLTDHMNVHSGIKPYTCQFCGVNFQNDSNRIAHVRKLHRNIIP